MIDGVLTVGKGVDLCRAKAIADRFETEIIQTAPMSDDAAYFIMDKTGISFYAGGLTLKGDLSSMLPRVKNGHLDHEILIKAAKCDNPGLRAVDATAGLGEDSFLLAAKGYEVTLCEHNPITAVLLRDALMRAKSNPECREIAKRMTLIEGDSKEILANLGYKPALIYLDPMFPEKKKSAETKKKLQLLHKIETPCSDESMLLNAAISAKPDKIIIKRPNDGPFLAGITPTYSITRTAVRFDCITL